MQWLEILRSGKCGISKVVSGDSASTLQPLQKIKVSYCSDDSEEDESSVHSSS